MRKINCPIANSEFLLSGLFEDQEKSQQVPHDRQAPEPIVFEE